MFSLLNPFLLWLAPLVVGPLVIHFLGRAEPKARDFPSLLPVRGQLLRAMQRHRLKNWLQLILRTLALLCLLLAAAGPVWRSAARWAPPEASAMLLHNGAYGRLALESQQRLRHSLDSLTPGRNDAELVLPEAPPGRSVARFGDFRGAVARLLQRAENGTGAGANPHIFIPVFDVGDLAGIPELVRPWLERHPRARLVWVDYTNDAAREKTGALSPFTGATADFGKEGEVRLRAALEAHASEGAEDGVIEWRPDQGAAREMPPRDGQAEITVPLPEDGNAFPIPGTSPSGSWVAGSFAWKPKNGSKSVPYAESLYTVAWHVPPQATLCVIAAPGAWIPRASLGAGGKRLKVLPLLSGNEVASARCDLLYLADPENPDAALWSRAVAVLRAGGKVVIGTGRHTDAALLNRNLLEPLGIGRLTALSSHASLAAQPREAALKKLGLRAQGWGRPGAVREHLGFLPGPATSVLLSAANEGQEVPLLAHARAGSGEVLLWTTDITDPKWSDIGLGPWAALLHQSFLARAGSAGAEERVVDSDSSLFVDLGASLPEEAGAPRVIDPQGSPVALWKPEPEGGPTGRIGPFDRTGLYRLETDRDTTVFAVRLAASRLTPPAEAVTEEAWARLDSALGKAAAARTARLENPLEWRGLYGGFNLRFGLLILAALLLFAEGLVSLRLSAFRSSTPSTSTLRD